MRLLGRRCILVGARMRRIRAIHWVKMQLVTECYYTRVMVAMNNLQHLHVRPQSRVLDQRRRDAVIAKPILSHLFEHVDGA